MQIGAKWSRSLNMATWENFARGIRWLYCNTLMYLSVAVALICKLCNTCVQRLFVQIKIRLGERDELVEQSKPMNSPNLYPIIWFVIYIAKCSFLLWIAIVCPSIVGIMVNAWDQLLFFFIFCEMCLKKKRRANEACPKVNQPLVGLNNKAM